MMNHWFRRFALVVTILVACTGFSASASAASLNITTPLHHTAYQKSNTLYVTASVTVYQNSVTPTVNSFKIYINDVAHNATTVPFQGGCDAHYTLDVTGDPNPKQYDCYAIAQVTFNYYGIHTDDLDSRNANSNPNGASGDGRVTSVILADSA